MKRYIALNPHNSIGANYLEISTFYKKSNATIFTGASKERIERGFYIRVVPVHMSNELISYIYSTKKFTWLIEPANRYSQKKENTINNDVFSALDKIDIVMNDTPFTKLVNQVLSDNNLILA